MLAYQLLRSGNTACYRADFTDRGKVAVHIGFTDPPTDEDRSEANAVLAEKMHSIGLREVARLSYSAN